MNLSPILGRLGPLARLGPDALEPALVELRWLDLLGLATILGFLLLGARRGLWWQLVRLCGVLAAISVARAIAPRIAPAVAAACPDLPARLAHGLSWFLVLGLGLVVVALVGRVGKATLDTLALAPLDRIAGALAGALSGLLVHVALVLVLCQLATRGFSIDALEGTQSRAVVDVIGRNVPRLFDTELRAAFAREPGAVR